MSAAEAVESAVAVEVVVVEEANSTSDVAELEPNLVAPRRRFATTSRL